TVTWSAPQGSHLGMVSASGSHAWYWVAPPRFRGDLSAAYGKLLTFDLDSQYAPVNCGDELASVVLDGGGFEIYCNAPYLPAQAWTSYAVSLGEAGWNHAGTNSHVSAPDMKRLLGNLQQVRIRGWFFYPDCGTTTTGTGGIQNIVLGGTRPPALLPIRSDFSSNDDDWTIAGGTQGTGGTATWTPPSGEQPGNMTATGSGPWYWIAPAKFHGDLSAAYGKALTFDLDSKYAPVTCGDK